MVIKLGSVLAAPESVTYYKAGYGEALHLQVVRKWKGFCVKTDSLPTIWRTYQERSACENGFH